MKGYLSVSLLVLVLFALVHEGKGLYCHRCNSAMGGCGETVNLMLFPWRSCGESEYCVKVIEKWGSDVKITRECESELMKSTRHRLRMPVLRRHGYCINARKNDPYNPQQTSDPNIQYCFCNDFNACNIGTNVKAAFMPMALFSIIVTFIMSKFS